MEIRHTILILGESQDIWRTISMYWLSFQYALRSHAVCLWRIHNRIHQCSVFPWSSHVDLENTRGEDNYQHKSAITLQKIISGNSISQSFSVCLWRSELGDKVQWSMGILLGYTVVESHCSSHRRYHFARSRANNSYLYSFFESYFLYFLS